MQGYPYKVKTSRAECFTKQEDGSNKVTCRYFEVKGGLSIKVDGVELTELKAVAENGSDNVMWRVRLPDGKGGTSEDIMSPKNWGIFVLNHSAIVRAIKSVGEAEKTKDVETKKRCLELARTIKHLSATTMKATLKAEGFNEAAQDYAVYELGKEAEIEAAKVKK